MNLKPLFILLIICSGIAPVSADFPRHVNPDLLRLDNPDPNALFDLYRGIYEEISQSRYTSALELLVTVDELYATPEAKQSLSDYNLLLRQVISELNETELTIDKAYNDLFWLQETDAYNALLEAAPILLEANGTTFDLGAESLDVARILSGSPSVLLDGTGQMEELLVVLDQMILQGFLRVDQIISDKLAGLETTTLTTSVNNSTPFPGDKVLINGILSTSNGRLSDKPIEIRVNGANHGISETGENGEFLYSLLMPELYVNSVPVQTSYWPSTEETGHYSPAIDQLTLNPSFYTPVLEFEVPETVLPGIQYSFKSHVGHNRVDLVGLSFVVHAFGGETIYTSDKDGSATIFISVPNNAPTGRNPITLFYPGEGMYGPASLTRSLDTVQMQTYIELDSLGVHLSGRNAIISGGVYMATSPVQGCLVEVQLGEEIESTFTDDEGKFSAMFALDLLTPSIRQEFVVTATPEKPWFSKTFLSNSFLVINSLSLFLIPGALVLYLVTRKPRPEIDPTVLPVTPIAAPLEYKDATGIAGIYLKAVKIVSRLSGTYLRPSDTLQEYQKNIQPKIMAPLFNVFRRLSRLYEGWIYGPKDAKPPINISGQFLEQMQEKDEEN